MKFPYLVTGVNGLNEALLSMPCRMISLLDPGKSVTAPAFIREHLELKMLDFTRTSGPAPLDAPSPEHIRAILHFGDMADFCAPKELTLVCCNAGVSRSTATSLILIAQRFGAQDLPGAAEWLWHSQPEVFPNLRMLQIADQVMNLPGALSRAGAVLRQRWVDINGSPMATF